MSRLKDFFQQSGISIEQLQKKTGILKAKLHSMLEGHIEPGMNDLRKLAKAFNLPISYLLKTDANIDRVKVMFRNEIKTSSNYYEADKFSSLIGNSFALLGDYEADQKLSNYFSPIESNFENARLLAIKFRELYVEGDQVGSLFNLPVILEQKLKCIIYVSEIGADGASAYINKVPFIFVSPRFEGRMLFTCAHELGHILGHYDKSGDFVHYDENIFKGSSSSDPKQESFANVFASNLLMPEKGVGIALKKIREHLSNQSDQVGDVEIIYLSRLYGVSFETAAMRMENLSLLPKGGAYSLVQEVKKNYGSPEKRAEKLGIPAREKINFPKVSSTLVSSAIAKIMEGELSIGKASEILSLSVKEILSKHVGSVN